MLAEVSTAIGALRGMVPFSPAAVAARRVEAARTNMSEAQTAVACAFELWREERR
jgi:hypothetical protein